MQTRIADPQPGVNVLTTGLMVIYFYLFFVALPLLSPLRNLGLLEPALIRNAVLPPLVILIIFSVGLRRVLKVKSALQLVLLIMFFQAMAVGLGNIIVDNSYRNYFSHLFQTSSAYVLLMVGWITYRSWSEKFWKVLVFSALVAAFISSAVTINALGRGEIGRFYTAAYGFILVSAYAANSSSTIAFASFLGVIISNKRAVVLSVLAIVFFRIIGADGQMRERASLSRLVKKIFTFFAVAVVIFSLSYVAIQWLERNPSTGLGLAYSISVNRLEQVVHALAASDAMNDASAGRLLEIEAVLATMDSMSYLVGNGAGWQVQLESGREVQNIHFTPLSLVAVYGGITTAVFYVGSLVIYFRFILRGQAALSLTEKMAPFYFVGALVHSFFAYSLFIDWMFFFFIGVMARSLKESRRIRPRVAQWQG